MPPARRGTEEPAPDPPEPARARPPDPTALGGVDSLDATSNALSQPSSPGPFGLVERRQRLGQRGEDLAADWYRDRGYEVVDRNWRCREGEIDLIARKARLFVFCEVKARSTNRFGTPAEAVTRTKQARIRRLAARWLQDAAPARAREIRFDVACVLGERVEVIEGAF